jgi:radical SAM superfamily enzyme YgiQ (UPF0313 family)
MNKKIIFVEPSGSIANVFDNAMKLPLLGTLYLGTILHDAGYEVEILNENLLRRKLHPIELAADFVCFSCLTVNSNRASDLAKGVRSVYPNAKIIVGGIHPSLLPEEFKLVADHIVIGEAEDIIVDIIKGRFSEQIITGHPIKNLDTLPLMNYSLLRNSKEMDIIPIMTSRGCPFNCNFCTVTKVFGRLYRQQSVNRIISEIKHAVEYFNTLNIFFYDDNFTTNKKFSNELIDSFIKEKLNISWTAQVRADIANDDSLLKKMFKAGCTRVYIGFESVDDKVLAAYGKSQTKADIEKAIKKIHEHGINIHGMFMFGEDNDTVESIHATVDFTIKNYVDTLQYMILTPFPGTQIYDKLNSENRLMHKNWDYFNGMYVVHYPKQMLPSELQSEVTNAYKTFYSFKRTMLDLLYFVFNVSFDAMFWNFSRVKRYDIGNLYLKTGAKLIIRDFLKYNSNYLNYLTTLNTKRG